MQANTAFNNLKHNRSSDMRKFTLYFDTKADAKLTADYLLNIKADCKLKIKNLFLTNRSLVEVSTKLTEKEFRNFYNI